MSKVKWVQNPELIRIANAAVLKTPQVPLLKNVVDDVPLLIKIIDDKITNLHKNKKLLLPNFIDYPGTVMALSDYGGESKGSAFNTYSFLFAYYDALHFFFKEIQNIRSKYKLVAPYREMAFKNLNDSYRQESLDDWLRTSELIPGLLFTLVIDKKIISAIGPDEKKTEMELVNVLKQFGFKNWKPGPAEKLLRILHVISYFLALLADSKHKIFWMTDNDDIIANDEKKKHVGDLLGSIMHVYSPRIYKSVGYAATFAKKEQEMSENNICDLVSYSDLVAGAIDSILTISIQNPDPMIKETTNKILMWLCHQGIGLKKLIIKIEKYDGGIGGSVLEFYPKVQTDGKEVIPVTF